MRVGFVFERKAGYSFGNDDPPDSNSELLSEAEERELIAGLRATGHTIVSIGDTHELIAHLADWQASCDIVLNRSVGYRGVERKSTAASVLDAAGLPYIGSSPYVLTLTRNKYHAKLVVRDAGLATPPAALLFGGVPDQLDALTYPAIVKPVAESSSIGIEAGKSIADTPGQARARAEQIAQRYRQPALVESFVHGIEVEVPLLVDPEPYVLGIAAVTINGAVPPPTHYLSSEAVYVDQYDYIAPPAELDTDRIAAAAIRAARALGIRDYGRIDFRIGADGQPWFIEASTHPHIQRHSSFFMVAQQHGMDYPDLLDRLIQIAARRNGLVY